MIKLIPLCEIKVMGFNSGSAETIWDKFVEAAGDNSAIYGQTVKFFKTKYPAADMGIKNFIREHASQSQLKEIINYLNKMINLINTGKI